MFTVVRLRLYLMRMCFDVFFDSLQYNMEYIVMSDNYTGKNKTNLIITLTDNHWLSVGVKNILPEVEHLSFRFDSKVRLSTFHSACKIFIAVDSLIFLRGEWNAYNSLFNNNVIVIWLVRKETGLVFPSSGHGGHVFMQKENINSLRKYLFEVITNTEAREHKTYACPIVLTRVERYLLPFFMQPINILTVSKETRRNPKLLYLHRSNIMRKLGGKNLTFMQVLYQQNENIKESLSIKTKHKTL